MVMPPSGKPPSSSLTIFDSCTNVLTDTSSSHVWQNLKPQNYIPSAVCQGPSRLFLTHTLNPLASGKGAQGVNVPAR